MKKFEEGVFSDLRSLKAGIDATLEVPKVKPHALVYPCSLPKVFAKLTAS